MIHEQPPPERPRRDAPADETMAAWEVRLGDLSDALLRLSWDEAAALGETCETLALETHLAALRDDPPLPVALGLLRDLCGLQQGFIRADQRREHEQRVRRVLASDDETAEVVAPDD